MTGIEETVHHIVEAESWDERIEAIRRVPERHGQSEHREVYAGVAAALYRPHLSPQFAFVEWREEYDSAVFAASYRLAHEGTDGFRRVAPEELAALLTEAPQALLALRTIVGYTPNELAIAARELPSAKPSRGITGSRIKTIEQGSRPSAAQARLCAETIVRLVQGELWGAAPEGLRTKLEKFDTLAGWSTVREVAANGVPYEAFLHQRHYGGAFRTLLDAMGSRRGALLENEVADLLDGAGVPYLQTGSSRQSEIATRFNLTVRPAPDFVLFEPPNQLRALIECKQANDGGTARDKASRYGALRNEAVRLGGVALFAVLDGLGWERVNDALGPVVRDCDGRVFTLQTLPQMLEVQPLPGLKGRSGGAVGTDASR